MFSNENWETQIKKSQLRKNISNLIKIRKETIIETIIIGKMKIGNDIRSRYIEKTQKTIVVIKIH